MRKTTISRLLSVILLAVCYFTLVGCASIPLAPKEQDEAMKQFPAPSANMAGLYIYRDSFVGQALLKRISLDGQVLGQTANKTYFYREVTPGPHIIATQSEFSDNTVEFDADAGKNYFARQYIKMGVFVGGAGIKMVEPEEGMKDVKNCRLAK